MTARVALWCLGFLAVGALKVSADGPALIVPHAVGGARSLAFFGDSYTAAIGGTHLSVTDLVTGLERWHEETRLANAAVAVSADGSTVVGLSEEGTGAIYDAATGQELVRFADSSVATAISADATTIVTTTIDGQLRVWRGNGREAYAQQGTMAMVAPATAVAVSDDGRYAAIAGADSIVRVCDLGALAVMQQISAGSRLLSSVAISADGKTVVAGSWDGAAYLWRRRTVRRIDYADGRVSAVAVSRYGEWLAIGGESSVSIWSASSPVKAVARHDSEKGSPTGAVAFSRVDQRVAAISAGGLHYAIAPQWRWTKTQQPNAVISEVVASPQGRWLAVAASRSEGMIWHPSTFVWDVRCGCPVRHVDGNEPFFVSEEMLGTVDSDNRVRLWDPSTGLHVRDLEGFRGLMPAEASAGAGRIVLSGGTEVSIWDLSSRRHLDIEISQRSSQLVPRISRSGREVIVAFQETLSFIDLFGSESRDMRTSDRELVLVSPDERWFVAIGQPPNDRRIRITQGEGAGYKWEGTLGQRIDRVAFTPDGNRLLVVGETGTMTLLNIVDGTTVGSAPAAGHSPKITFSSDGRFLFATGHGMARILALPDLSERGWMVITGDDSWAVVDREGRYDASNPAHTGSIGYRLKGQQVALHRLRKHFYEPGLLSAILEGRDLSSVPSLTSIPLSPRPLVTMASGNDEALIAIEDRGGGMGDVRVLLNGREIMAGRAAGVFSVLVDETPLRKHGENRIEVIASNAEGTLASDPATATWVEEGVVANETEVWVVGIGAATYATPALNLPYAATDATILAETFALAARRRFGDEAVHLLQLTGARPTRAAVHEALSWLASSKPEHIVVVYLAGHGLGFEREHEPEYWYVTTEAASLAEADLTPESTVRTEDLVERLRAVPALRQLWIVDTCSAGAAEGAFHRIAWASGAQRAMVEYHARTGFDVLFATTAFGPAFQSELLRRSILTHSLLTGLKGAALRGGQYVDADRLLHFTVDDVARIAPRLVPPDHFVGVPRKLTVGASFDIGKLEPPDRDRIAFGAARPFVVRPQLLDLRTGTDTLRLAAAVRRLLAGREAADNVPVLYLDEESDDEEVLEPSGNYVVDGDEVSLSLQLTRKGITVSQAAVIVSGKGNEIVQAVVEAVDAMVRKICGDAV